MYPLLFQKLRGLQGVVHQHAVGQNGDVRPGPQGHGRLIRVVSPVGPLPATGIADGHGALDLEKRLAEHMPQLREAGGTEHREARDLREEQRVEAAVMGLAVGAHQSRPVHPQHYMEVHQRHVVDQLVVPPLQEGGVHGEHRDHPLGRQARRHGHPVSLGDGHVEKPLRMGLGKGIEPRAVRHGGGDGAHPGILPGAVRQGLAEDGGEALSPGFFQKARLGVEGGHAVELAGIALGVGVALALDALHMDHHGPPQLPGPLEHIHQAVQVVAVDRSQVGKAHVLEEGAAGEDGLFQGGFHPMVEAVDGMLRGLGPEEPPVPLFEVVIGGLGAEPRQMGGHGPHIGVDGHAVVVEDDDERLPRGPGVVEALVGKAAGQGAVPDEGQDAVIRVL